MDYAMPRADPFLVLKTALSEVPAPLNRLGMHSSGERGTTPALAAVSDAIVDAVAELGVDHIEMLATPESLPQKSPSPIIGSNGPLLKPTSAIRSSPRECVFMLIRPFTTPVEIGSVGGKRPSKRCENQPFCKGNGDGSTGLADGRPGSAGPITTRIRVSIPR